MGIIALCSEVIPWWGREPEEIECLRIYIQRLLIEEERSPLTHTSFQLQIMIACFLVCTYFQGLVWGLSGREWLHLSSGLFEMYSMLQKKEVTELTHKLCTDAWEGYWCAWVADALLKSWEWPNCPQSSRSCVSTGISVWVRAKGQAVSQWVLLDCESVLRRWGWCVGEAGDQEWGIRMQYTDIKQTCGLRLDLLQLSHPNLFHCNCLRFLVQEYS